MDENANGMIADPVAHFHQSKFEELSMAKNYEDLRLCMASWIGLFLSQRWSQTYTSNYIYNGVIFALNGMKKFIKKTETV